VSPHPSEEGRGSWVSGHARFGGDEEEDGIKINRDVVDG